MRAVVPLTDPDVAVIVVTPVVAPVAKPVAVMVATFGAEEVQVTEDVRSLVLASDKVPVALNC